ncbi:glycosyltransferase family 2 protein [Rasiella rasia]|uniref:Glycosyltransferase family 2 protein n=1 Tax=Rasiella rasia TaxID=2744027 RepID=A0A6G6GPI7_9FLAO|nr:DUF5672 family protein [Rasiella rasia]QIE60462.1 glycosyltransferase family 2 protein [Rasiella rasia]
MISLDNVTLIGVDCVQIERLILAAEISQLNLRFKEVKLLTHLESNHPQVVRIPELNSVTAYSKFVIKELYKYVDTEYALLIQHDGYVLNAAAWSPNFLDFDYIGAPTDWGMGNGGFSLRSKKLLQCAGQLDNVNQFHPEDVMLCKKYRSALENRGMRFANLETAFNFSVENYIWNGQFGFHNADISNWNSDALSKHPRLKNRFLKLKTSKKQCKIKLTYVVQIYEESPTAKPFMELLKIYAQYSADVLRQIHFVFVDDHSNPPLQIPTQINLNYTLLRITENIPWNQAGARNLGVTYAKSDYVILTDIDVVFPETLLERLLNFELPADAIFKFKTICNLQPVVPHFNTFFTSKKVFWKSNGVDEAFSGAYGFEDLYFYYLQKALGTKFYVHSASNIVYREHTQNKLTLHNHLSRDKGRNQKLYEEKMSELKHLENPLDARSTIYLNFGWSVVQSKTFNTSS